MDKNAEEKLLQISVRLRMKFEDDLRWIIQFSHDHPEIGLGTILIELQNLHIHFVKLEAIVSSTIKASTLQIHRDQTGENIS
jgi:hypothetical protein